MRAQGRAEGLQQPHHGLGLCCTLRKKRTARFLCPRQKNILEMLRIICHSQLWYIRRNTRQDVPWPGVNPVAGEKAERRLLWEHQVGDRSKKRSPKSPRGTEEFLSTFQVGIAETKAGSGDANRSRRLQECIGPSCPWLLSCLLPSIFFPNLSESSISFSTSP